MHLGDRSHYTWVLMGGKGQPCCQVRPGAEEVTGGWEEAPALCGVTGSTAGARMVHTSTRGLESTQTGAEKILPECSGGATSPQSSVYPSFKMQRSFTTL